MAARKPKPVSEIERYRVEECLHKLARLPVNVTDVETSGLDWKRNHIIGYVFTFGPFPEDSYYLPFRHLGGGNIPGVSIPTEATGWAGDLHPIEREIAKCFKEHARITGARMIGHNVGFDLKFMHRHGIDVECYIEDTSINAPLLNEFAASFSLETCARDAGVEAKKGGPLYEYMAGKFGGAADKQQMGNYWRTDANEPIVYDYATGDGTSTWQLREWQNKEIAREDMAEVHDIECRLIPILARTTQRGIKVDEERLHEVKKIVTGRLTLARQKLPEGFSERSGVQVRKLFEAAGITDWPKTSLGNPSFPEEFLKKSDLGKSIIAVRKYGNLISSFIEPMINTHLFKGRVHTDYHQLRNDEYGTITGRLSSSSPNLQQVPKRNKELGRIFRSIFVPDAGMVWEDADYSQMEPRLLAYYARIKTLLNDYRNNPNADAHQAVATAAGIDREFGKRLNQGLITGMGDRKAMASIPLPPAQASMVLQRYFASMPELKPFQKKAASVMRARGYVVSLLGRHARLRDQRLDYQAMNRLLQCGNADALKLKMVEMGELLHAEGDKHLNLLNNCHDAFSFQRLLGSKGQELYDECLRIMTSFGESDLITLDVPMKMDASSGPNWAVATYGPDK